MQIVWPDCSVQHKTTGYGFQKVAFGLEQPGRVDVGKVLGQEPIQCSDIAPDHCHEAILLYS
jgi:hypothetical protein